MYWQQQVKDTTDQNMAKQNREQGRIIQLYLLPICQAAKNNLLHTSTVVLSSSVMFHTTVAGGVQVYV